MRLLALTVSLVALASFAQSPVGTYKQGPTVIVISQSGPTTFQLAGFEAGPPITLEKNEQLLTGSAGLFKPVRIHFAPDWAVADVETRSGRQSFARVVVPASITPPVWPNAVLREMNQRGRNLIREGKWAEARGVFQELLDNSATFGGGAVQQDLARCDKEIPNEQHLDRARELIDQNQLVAAQSELSSVTADTLQIERREKLNALLVGKQLIAKKQAKEAVVSTEEAQRKMRELNRDAQEKIAAGRYLDAQPQLLAIQQLDPTYGGGQVEQNLALCAREIPYEMTLLRAARMSSRRECRRGSGVSAA